jgi:hypothetical protein
MRGFLCLDDCSVEFCWACTVFSDENYAHFCAHPRRLERAVSVQEDRGRWLVRWRDGSGRQRGKRFESERAAREFDGALADLAP